MKVKTGAETDSEEVQTVQGQKEVAGRETIPYFERLKIFFRGSVNITCPRAPTPLVTPLVRRLDGVWSLDEEGGREKRTSQDRIC